MSNQDKKNRLSSVATTTESAPEESDASLEMLTPREEKVIRMHNGLSEDDSRALQFALGANQESSMKLAWIEQQLTECLTTDNPDDQFDDDRPSPAELLSAWLDDE